MSELLQLTDSGLYCARGDFHVDPWGPVARAVITHAHSDHARWGSESYLTASQGEGVLRARMGSAAHIQAVAYGEPVSMNGVRVSLHPAGHILGSAQVRIEYAGEVWVVSGDYKTEHDPTCAPFEPVRCSTFVTECTFGLPIYRWPAQQDVVREINSWWQSNAARKRTSVIFAYPLGKSQRVLAGLDPDIGPILIHGALRRLVDEYARAGVALPATSHATSSTRAARDGAVVIAPPSATSSPWMRRFDPSSTAFVSGWMQIRGARRRRSVDRGFVLSDHVDWPALLGAIEATGAENVWATHGYTAPLVRWLRERGLNARAIATRFEGEGIEDDAPVTADEEDSGAEPA